MLILLGNHGTNGTTYILHFAYIYIYIVYIYIYFIYIYIYILLIVYLITEEVQKWHSEENVFHIRPTNAIQIIIANII